MMRSERAFGIALVAVVVAAGAFGSWCYLRPLRPAIVLPMLDGSVLVSDDKKGAIWKVNPVR